MNFGGNSGVISGLESASTYLIQVAARFENGEMSNLSSPIIITMFDIRDSRLDVFHANLRGAFDYLWNEANMDFNSSGFGIVRDDTSADNPNRSNIAAVGFKLAALPTAVDQGFITWEEGYKRAYGTLRTFYNTVPHTNGFFKRFIRVDNGMPLPRVEVSVIDSALLFSGMVVASEFFGHGVTDFWNDIYDRVNWEWYRNSYTNRFYMGYYSPADFPDRPPHLTGFQGAWDMAAEQFVMYVLGAGSNTNPVNGNMFYDFMRHRADFRGFSYYRSWENALFHYQFSHAFIDFRNTFDREGVDWFVNSQQASMGNRAFAISNLEGSLTHGPNSWGISAGMTFEGYRGGMGAYPALHWDNPQVPYRNNGTIFPYAMISSIMLTPEYSIAAMNYQKNRHGDRVWGRYGFIESINLDQNYFSEPVFGLNKGIEFLSTANFLFGDIWRYFMQNENVQQGLRRMEVLQRWEWSNAAD